MPNLEEQEVLADTLRQADLRLPLWEWLNEGLVALGYVLATAALWAIQPPGSFSVIPATICLLTMVVATRVRFDTPYGFTVATQLAFVPLLFALPLALVPIAVAVAMTAARVPEVVAGTHPPSRLIKEVSNSWFAIGPVAVFVAAHVEPANAGPLLLIAALLAQFAIDFSVSTLRFWMERSATFASQLRETWVYAIDAR